MADKNGAPGPDKRFTNDESPAPSVLKTISRAAVGEHRILSILLAIGLLYTLYFARNFLFPVLIALLLFLVLEPIVEYLRRWKVPRGFAAAIVLAFLVILIAGAFYQLASPAVDWINRGPQIRWKIQHKLRNLKKSIKEARETTQEIEQVTHPETEKKDKVVVKGLSLADRILAQTQSTLAYTAIVLVLIYFLLAGGDKTLKRFALVFGGKEGEGVYTELAGTVQREISRYLRTIGLINLGLGTLTASAMALLGMPTPLLWGALACVLNFIPYLGAAMTCSVIAVVSLLTFTSWPRIILPPVVFLSFTALEGQFITPMILGRRFAIDPVLLFLTLLLFGWLWGIPGALLAVPVLTTFRIIVLNVDRLKRLRALFN